MESSNHKKAKRNYGHEQLFGNFRSYQSINDNRLSMEQKEVEVLKVMNQPTKQKKIGGSV